MSEPLSLSAAFQGVVDRINALDTQEQAAGGLAYQGILREANQINAEMLGIVERLAMAVSTVNATAKQVIRGIGQLKGSPEGDRRATALATAIDLFGMSNEAFADEIAFSERINQLVSQKILVDAGVNPEDPEAVKRFVETNLNR